jgi:hypothetical protein
MVQTLKSGDLSSIELQETAPKFLALKEFAGEGSGSAPVLLDIRGRRSSLASSHCSNL